MLPAVVDQTILAGGLPTIAGDLGRLGDVAWLVSAYVVAATAFTPVWGKLGDRLGHKRPLQAALTIFIACSALCGLAQDMTQLVGLRVVQGAAAGGLMVLAMASVGALVAPQERPRYQGIIAATFAGATALGPLLGGLLVDHAGWRWVFYVNLPIGIVALVLLGARLPDRRPERAAAPMDVAGAAMLAASTAAFVLACVVGGDRYGWGSPQVLGLFGAAAILAAGLVVRERRAADPVVPLALLGTPVVRVASTTLFLGTAALFCVTVFVPLLAQVVAGASPTEAGLLLVPMTIGLTASTTLAGRRIARTGRLRRYPVAGLAIMAVALGLMAATAGEDRLWPRAAVLALFGVGFGLVTQLLVVAVQNSVDRAQLGVATATTSFFRALGGAIGSAVLGSIFAAQAGAGARASSLGAVGAVARDGVVDGVRIVFVIGAVLAAVAALVATRLPEPQAPDSPARTRSASPAAPGSLKTTSA
jgi:EmrB/QacA subfamily drug resistance transporter